MEAGQRSLDSLLVPGNSIDRICAGDKYEHEQQLMLKGFEDVDHSAVLERLRECDDNIKAAAKLVDNSAITPSVLQLSAEQLHFDPDVNEFERDVAVLMLKDPQLTYTGETMHRQKAKTPPPAKTLEAKSKKSIRKNFAEAPKLKSSEEMEKEANKTNEQKQSPPKGNDSKRTVQEVPEEEKNPNKTKFKPPANIAKADAKDPAYETLQGIGNELFNEPKQDKSKEEKEKLKEKQEEQPTAFAEKQKFKQPDKIQKADAKDPQYETLANVKDDIFKG